MKLFFTQVTNEEMSAFKDTLRRIQEDVGRMRFKVYYYVIIMLLLLCYYYYAIIICLLLFAYSCRVQMCVSRYIIIYLAVQGTLLFTYRFKVHYHLPNVSRYMFQGTLLFTYLFKVHYYLPTRVVCKSVSCACEFVFFFLNLNFFYLIFFSGWGPGRVQM